MKGKCYSQESKKGMSSRTYRVKQVRAKNVDNGAGVPSYSAQHWQGPNPEWIRRGREMTWIGNQVRLER
jgi:hypothetical protein